MKVFEMNAQAEKLNEMANEIIACPYTKVVDQMISQLVIHY